MTNTIQPPVLVPRWRVWFLAVRPWSLTISVIPILLASALAWVHGSVSIPYLLFMLGASVLTHIACNLTNDYFDDASGVDSMQKEGHGRMLQEGRLTKRDLRLGMVTSFSLALLLGLPIIFRIGWIGLILAIIGAGVAFLYTGGPWPLAYNRMGEIGVFVAMGLVMICGAFYVHTNTITFPAVIMAINLGLYAAAILHANNMRDIAADAMHQKHTLANTFGWQWGVREYIVLVVLPLLLTLILVALAPEYWALLATISVVPVTWRAVQHLRSRSEGTLTSAIVGQNTRLHKHYGVIATVVLSITALVQL